MLEKTFALHHFWTLKNCILEVLWNQISVYFCIYLSELFCSRDVARFYLVETVLEGGSLINFFKAARYLGLIKCFAIFHFSWSFWKFNIFLHQNADNLDLKGKIVVKFLIRSFSRSLNIKWYGNKIPDKLNMGPFKNYVTCKMAFFTPFNFVTLCQFYSITSLVLYTKLHSETIE